MEYPSEVTITKEHWMAAKQEADEYIKTHAFHTMGFYCPLNQALRPFISGSEPFAVGLNDYDEEGRYIALYGVLEAERVMIAFDDWYLDYTDQDRPEIPIQLPVTVRLK